MKKVIWFICLFLPFSILMDETNAADVISAYEADINTYKLAQNKHSTHLITYIDKDGDLLKNILNPIRYEAAIQSSQSNPHDMQRMSQLTHSQLDLIEGMYRDAFAREWGKYDQEYLDILDMKLRAFKVTWRQFLFKHDVRKMTPDDKAQVKLLFSKPESMITELDHNIKKRRFSKGYTSQALARLAMLKGMVQTTKPKI